MDFPEWLRNRLISAGLDPVPSHNEKSHIALYYRYEYRNNDDNIHNSEARKSVGRTNEH